MVIAAIQLWIVLFAPDRQSPRLGGRPRAAVGFGGVAVLLLGSATAGGGAPWALAVVVLASLSWAIGSFVGATPPSFASWITGCQAVAFSGPDAAQ